MPRQTDYPRASLKNALQLAAAVHELGGECTVEMAADKLSKKVGGAFTAQYSSAAKYGMVTNAKGQLKTTEGFRKFKLAYSKEEEKDCLIKFILSPPAFNKVYERFKNIELPVSHFDRLLIREFDVPEQDGSKVAKYFIEGAKQAGILLPDNKMKDIDSEDAPFMNSDDEIIESSDVNVTPDSSEIIQVINDSHRAEKIPALEQVDEVYSVQIIGPGMNSVIKIIEKDDIAIVELMLNKIRKKLE